LVKEREVMEEEVLIIKAREAKEKALKVIIRIMQEEVSSNWLK
jgi:hypothetical protein